MGRGKQRIPLSVEALEMVAARFRAIGEPARLQLLQYLMDGEASVQQLCEGTGLGQANVSKHLALLVEQGILSRRREGSFAMYQIIDPSIVEMCDLVCGALTKRFSQAKNTLSR